MWSIERKLFVGFMVKGWLKLVAFKNMLLAVVKAGVEKVIGWLKLVALQNILSIVVTPLVLKWFTC